ncbi:MAG: MFS transporter [Spirochaetota bacterium]|nr:MFS transporter [Spirochaetota bacterium]
MSVSYFQIVKQNAAFRWLWFSQMTSLAGDWFNRIALMDFISDPIKSGITESGFYISLVLICSFLPQFIISPVAGIVVDRLNRKTILILTDLTRGFLVLGFLFLSQNSLWLLFSIESTVFLIAAFFLSAKAAIIPTIVTSSNELVSANAISQMTWGVMLALGAFSAGIIIDNFGFKFAIIFNSLTYFVSAYFITLVDIDESKLKHNFHTRTKNAWHEFKKGVNYIIKDKFISVLIMVKPGWAIGGGAILMLHTVFGKIVFSAGSYGIGIFYMCRGIGVILGGIAGQWVVRKSEKLSVLLMVSILFCLYGLFYGIFSMMPSLFLAAIALTLATAFSSNLWLLSRTTLQKIVPNEYRGRIFSHDEGLSTFFMMASALVAGWGLDYFSKSEEIAVVARNIAFIGSVIMIGCGFIVLILSRFIIQETKLAK